MLAVLTDLTLYGVGALLVGAAVRWWRREIPWPAIGAYALLALAFVAPAVLTPAHQLPTDHAYQHQPWAGTLEEKPEVENGLLVDVVFQMIPFRTLVRERLLAGEAPLWAHEIGTGEPLLGNAQSAPFAPLHVLALPLPPLRGMTLTVAWQLLLGLLLTHALARHLGASPVPAAFSAVAYALSLFSAVFAYYPIGMTAMWVPGVLLGLLVLAEGGRGGLPGLTLCALGLILSGHPETVATTGLAASGVVLWWLLRGRPMASRRRFLVALAAAGGLTFCLAAPFLLPVAETVEGSQRMHLMRRLGHKAHSFDIERSAPLVSPLHAGSPREGNYDGPPNFAERSTIYPGLLVLALAVAGGLALRGRVGALLAGGTLCLLAALHVAPFGSLVRALPFFEHVRPERLRLYWLLALALAGGLALERWSRGDQARARRLAPALALAAATLAAAALPPPEEAMQRAAWLVALAGGLALLVVLVALRRPRRALAWTAVVALLAEVALLGMRYNPTVPPSLDLAPPLAVQAVLERAAEQEEPFRVLGEWLDLTPNLAAVYGLWDPRSNDPTRPYAPARFVWGRVDGETRRTMVQIETPETHDRAAQDYLGVRYLFTRGFRRLPPPWERIYRGEGSGVWENPEAMPLFYVPRRVETAGSQGEAFEVAMGIEDFARRVVAERPFPGHQWGSVRVLEVTANGFELGVRVPVGAVVASSISYVDGFRVSAGGRSLEPLRVNGAFLGFEVPAGTRRVSVRYAPPSWRLGWGLFALGVLAWGVVAWWWRRAPVP